MVTLLLGSAIIVNINDVDSFADPSYLAIFTLIIGTYVATIVFAVLVTRLSSLAGLAYAQLVGDVLLAGGLIYVTGGTQSVFAFLFYLTIINSAILMGRRAAFFVATACSVLFVGMLLMQLGILPWLSGTSQVAIHSAAAPVYSVIVNIVAYYLVGLLAGYLAQRLEEQDTELERKQLDIWELQALNQHILSSITSGVVTLDQSGRVLFLNRSAQGMLGRSIESIYGQQAVECLPELGESIEFLLSPMKAGSIDSVVEQSPWEGWVPLEEHEPKFFSITHSPLFDGQGQYYGHILTIQDQTLFHKMQRRVQRQERLAVVGQLAAAIAHEIRNPLASISGSVEMLQMFVDASADEERLMKIVLREIDRLNVLISDFLDYARNRRMSFETLELDGLIMETIELFKHDTELVAQIKVLVDVEACRGLQVQANADGIKQVFWNLLRNAAQAMDGEGTIDISVKAIAAERRADGQWESTPEATSGHAPRMLRLSVADTGPGIPEGIRERLFEPFFTTKRGGTGLGLATIYRIVEDHDGSIAVETSNNGTTFVIDLPLEQDTNKPVVETDPVLSPLVRRQDSGSGAPEQAAQATQETFRWK